MAPRKRSSSNVRFLPFMTAEPSSNSWSASRHCPALASERSTQTIPRTALRYIRGQRTERSQRASSDSEPLNSLRTAGCLQASRLALFDRRHSTLRPISWCEPYVSPKGNFAEGTQMASGSIFRFGRLIDRQSLEVAMGSQIGSVCPAFRPRRP